MEGAVESRSPAEVAADGLLPKSAAASPGLCAQRPAGYGRAGRWTVQCDRSRRLVRLGMDSSSGAQPAETSSAEPRRGDSP